MSRVRDIADNNAVFADGISTADITEGSNLYFTNTRADARAQLKIDALVDSAPGALDTLNELAAALGDDANFSTTMTNNLATKLNLTGGTMTGTVTVNTSGGDANDASHLGGDFSTWIRIGDPNTNQTQSNGFGIKLHDSGVIHWSVGGLGTSFKISKTNTNGSQLFPASRADYLTITTSGDVGIRDSSPSAPLDVKGSGSLGYPASGVDLPVGRRINLYHANQDHMIGMGNDGMFFTGNGTIRYAYKSGTNSNNGTNRLNINMVTGDVGIGIDPANAGFDRVLHLNGTSTSIIRFTGDSYGTGTNNGAYIGMSYGGADFIHKENSYLRLGTNSTERFRIQGNGRIGIGHSTNSVKGAFDVIWDYNGPDQGIYLKNSSTGTNAFTGTYYGNTSSDTDAFIGLNGANNPSYAGARSLLLGTNSSGAVAIMVGGTQVHTVAQAPSTSADGYSLTTPALTQTNQLYNMSGTILWDTINNNGWYGPCDYENAIKRYADIGSPTYRGSSTVYHNSHSGSVFNSTWCANRELFDYRAGVHYWRVPKSGTYTLTARGAGYNNSGGNGRSLTMDYVLYAGEWLRGVCGAQGESNNNNHMGGCGATAISVYRQGIHIPILIAGGGAGITPNSPGGTSYRRDAVAPVQHGRYAPYRGAVFYSARDGMGGHGSIYQHNYGTYINNWGGGGGGGWGTPGGHGGIGINMMEQMSGGRALSEDCPHGGYYQNGSAYHGGFGGGGASGIGSGAAGGGGGWFGGHSSYSTNSGSSDDTDDMGGGSYAAGSFTDNGAHQSYGQILIQI